MKRKCGTCRYYKDGGIAGSGWCQHPARRDLQNMVLVRKTELACRNNWDQDLWETGDGAIEAQASLFVNASAAYSEERPVDERGVVGPVAVPQRISPDELFTDKLTAISMPLRSQLRRQQTLPSGQSSVTEPPDDAPDERPGSIRDSRSAIHEARRRRQEQRHQGRQRHQEFVLQEAHDLLDKPDRPEPGQPMPLGERQLTGLHPSPTSEIGEPGQYLDPSPPERTPRPPAGRSRRRDDTLGPSIEFSANSESFSASSTKTTEVEPSPQSTREHAGRSTGRQAEPVEQGTEPLPLEDVRAVRQPSSRRAAERRSESLGQAADDDFAELFPPPVEPREHRWITGAGAIGQQQPKHDAQRGQRVLLPMALDPVDEAAHVSGIPRCCQTCRDFKQIGDGRKGWCGNAYAFPERRMVQSGDLTCRSSIGHWWLPNDEFWLEKADTTHHARPTPLLDEMTRVRVAENRGMGARSR